jgi:homoserine O-acetyltransferase
MPGSAAGAEIAAQGIKRIGPRALILYAPTDQVFAADWITATADLIRANGASVEMGEIAGPFGHLNGLAVMAPLSPQIASFLDR